MPADAKLCGEVLAHLEKHHGREFSLDDVRDVAMRFSAGPMEFLMTFIFLLNPIVDGKEVHIIPVGPDTYRIEVRVRR